MKGSNFLLLFFFICCSLVVQAQKKSKAELQKEKQEQLIKIQEVEKILTQTSNQKRSTLGELNALNQRIKVQENLISSIREEVEYIENEIDDKNEIVAALENDLEALKEEYAKMLYVAQKANQGQTMLSFIFSSKSFTQLLMRIQYLQQYGEARRKQAEEIQNVQKFLLSQAEELKGQRKEKNELLQQQIQQNQELASLKRKQNSVVADLRQQEQKLRRDLEDTRASVARLDKMIEVIIREEIARAEAAASTSALSNSFAENKSRLPWPVSGFVSQKFGRQNHPVLKNIVIENNGINIQTKKDELVKAIFSGRVTSVSYHPGVGSSIIVKHGDYYTVYAGLKDVLVSKGQDINTNQELGTVVTNNEGISELRFQVRKNIAALNPEKWLSRN